MDPLPAGRGAFSRLGPTVLARPRVQKCALMNSMYPSQGRHPPVTYYHEAGGTEQNYEHAL